MLSTKNNDQIKKSEQFKVNIIMNNSSVLFKGIVLEFVLL